MNNDEAKNQHTESAPDTKAEDAGSFSRREWFLRVGGAALAAGVPVLPGETVTSPPQDAKVRPAALLPPGLYSPSSECLGQALESDALFHPVPPGSETDYVRPLAGAFRPEFFSEDEFPVLHRLVALLLGLREGDVKAVSEWIDLRVSSAAGIRRAAQALSPERRAVAVAYSGAGPLEHLETNAPEPICREGLVWMEHASQQRYGTKFIELTEAQQIEIVKAMSDDQPEEGNENAGTRFFTFLKAEAVNGYYTSPAGLKELDYQGNQFHAESPRCNLPLKNH